MKKPSLLFTFSLLLFTSLVAQAEPILLKSGTIDPQGQSGRPKARLMAAGAPAAKGGLYIIQHEGAIPSGWRRQLRAAGARIRGYVPENAYTDVGSSKKSVSAMLRTTFSSNPRRPMSLRTIILRNESPVSENGFSS